ncbi:MAG: hypothetical protein K8R69_04870 [Deltaproteobacteria bacterium]|nr:hypothetical protein [Deltaproteobacteria bacterium]
MTPPLRVPTTTATPAPGSPDESPEVKVARSAVDQAGYARNGADAKYKAAVQDHGQDSAEAKAAKVELDQAQAKVESTQADLRKALKLRSEAKPAPQAPSKTPSDHRSGPAPKPTSTKPKTEDKAPKKSESVEDIFIELPPVRGEYIRFNSEIREILLKEPKLRKDLDKLLKEPPAANDGRFPAPLPRVRQRDKRP